MHIAFITSHYENLAIEYLSAVAKSRGHTTELFFEPALFHNFFYDSNFLHDNFFNFKNRILKKIALKKPAIAAFSVISDNYKWTLEMAAEIKKRTGAVIVFGGVHPTSVPEYVLRDKIADYLIIGEGEEAFADLAEALEKGEDPSAIPNIGGYKNGVPFLNAPRPLIANLDSLPLPDKELFHKECRLLVESSYMILASRGCSNACSYCWNSMIHTVYPPGKFFRRRSPADVIAELALAKVKFNIKRVTFYDEVFTSDRGWLNEFLTLYAKNIKLPYFCCVHPDNIDETTVALLEKSGASAVNIGIQTADEDVRKNILNRKGSNEQIEKALSILSRSNIFVYSNIMLNLPGENAQTLKKTLRFCSRNRADLPAIYWLRYYPKTKIVATAEKMGILTEKDVETLNESKTYMPYAIGGNTYNRQIAKMGNLALLSGFIPTPLMDRILDRGWDKFVPASNLLFPVIAITGMVKRLLRGKKNPFHYLTISDYFRIYVFYFRELLAFKFFRRF